MKKIKRFICSLLVLMAVFNMLPENVSPVITVEAATKNYDPSKAVAYAKVRSNVYNNSGDQCARFVSYCLKAGGLSDVSFGGPGDLMDYVVAKQYGNAEKVSDASIKKMKAGDFVVVLCNNHGYRKSGFPNRGLHTFFVTEVNQSEGYLRYSAKNEPHLDEYMSFSFLKKYNEYCSKCKDKDNHTTYIVHMKTCDHSKYNEMGDCTGCGEHWHAKGYNEYGICRKDGFDYYSEKNLTKIKKTVSGIATPPSGKTVFYVYTKPAMIFGGIKVKGGFLNLQTVDLSVKKAKIVAELTNHLGNKWYELEIDELPGTPVYVSVNSVTPKWTSSVTITNTGWDEKTVRKLSKPKGIDVKGMVSAVNSNLSMVTAAIFDRNKLESKLSAAELNKLLNKKTCSAEEVLTYATKTVPANYKSYKRDIKGPSFDLSEWNYELYFSKLPNNNNYVYIITGTDTNGVSKSVVYELNIGSSSTAKTKNDVVLDNNGSRTIQSILKGLPLLLPIVYSPGEELVGWTESDNRDPEDVKYKAGDEIIPENNITLYAAFKQIEPPEKPVLVASTYDLSEGASQLISWNAVPSADKYSAYVYDQNGTKIYEQSTTGTSTMIPFENAGTYTIKLEAFNKSEEGGSGESTQAVTVIVHGPSTVNFLDYNGNVWSTQKVPYGGTANTPTIPSRKGYLFSHWDGQMTNITEDTNLNAVYTPERYKVTFYDANGDILSDQYVTYNGDTPGSAVEPEAPVKENYTFTGWNTGDWQSVTESGIKVYPVYVWSNQDVPLTITITQVSPEGDGYWVYYTVTNHLAKPQTGRVVIAGKTVQGKFITQTESGAFFMNAGEGSTYSGNAYVPVDSADMSTLATVEVYVVDNYLSKKPIAQPDTYIIGSVDGEYSAWMTEEELNAFSAPYTDVETKTQYSKRNRETVTTTSSSYLDWTLESSSTRYTDWGNWSAWQDAAVTSSDLIDVKTQQVQVSAAYTEYRYGRYKSTNCSKGTWYHFNDKSAKSEYGGTWYTDYTSWSTTRRSVTDSNYGYATTNNTIGTGRYNSSKNRYYWDRYSIGGVNYWWEESRTISATYKTQYAYRTRSIVTDYTFSHWTDWSAWSDTVATETSTQQVQTRTVYRVKLTNSSQGDTYRFTGEVGASAEGKQAILTVYKVDAASDYSNQYIEQVTLGTNGAYDFKFDTLEVPSVQTGDYTVALTIEGATESLYIGTIEAPKPIYTVQFVDAITGESIDVQQVEEGKAATAPEAPDHDGYYFLGWEYGLGNIREDMRIEARYVEKEYVVVFIDNVKSTVVMKKDIRYGTPVEAPEVESPEGYNFRGWITEDGKSIDTVTDHMIVIADYENITNTVTYLNSDGETLVQQTVNYGDFANNPLRYFNEDVDENSSTGTEEPEEEYVTEDELNIPEGMYFAGWSEGAADPVTQSLTITPMLSYIYDVAEIVPSEEGGIYVGQQTITLSAEGEEESTPTVQYRMIASDGTEGEWIEYDLDAAPEITVAQTSVLEIQGEEAEKNAYTASYEYVILMESDLPAAPSNVSAAQNDSESVLVNWNSVNGADGYVVNITNDCDEVSVYDVGNTNSYTDFGVDELNTYTYSVAAYRNIENNGAAFQAEGDNSEEVSVFFSGENTLVTNVQISGPETVYESSAIQLTASVTPEDAYDTVVSWTAEEGTGDGYITCDGLFYGLSAGTVTVKAKALDGSEVYDTKVITVQEIEMTDATLTVSSGTARAGGTANVTVSVTENSHAEAIQFAVMYDNTKLALNSFEAGEAMSGLAPTISNPSEGVILFNWDSLSGLTAGGSLLNLTFDVNSEASGLAVIEVPVNDPEYDFIFAKGNDMTEINVAAVNGTLNITTLMYGDVNGDEKVNVIDANLVRRYSAKLIELDDTQLMAADVSGDNKVNVIDANLIRRYSARLITSFPVEGN